MNETLKERRRLYAPMLCKRGELAAATPPSSLSRSLLRHLKALDQRLTFYWHNPTKRWVLYRCFSQGAVPSDDNLVKVMTVEGPNGEYREPGHWLVDWLHNHNLQRKYGGSTPEQTARNQDYAIERHNEENKVRREILMKDRQKETARELGRIFRGRISKRQGDKLTTKAKAGRKVIAGPEVQELRH